MTSIGTTQVYQINGRLVVASDVVEAIGIYKEYYTSIDSYRHAPEIESVHLIKDEQTVSSSSALIRKGIVEDKTMLEDKSTELTESKDREIREEIILYLSNELKNVTQLTPRTNEYEKWIAWLRTK